MKLLNHKQLLKNLELRYEYYSIMHDESRNECNRDNAYAYSIKMELVKDLIKNIEFDRKIPEIYLKTILEKRKSEGFLSCPYCKSIDVDFTEGDGIKKANCNKCGWQL